MTIQTSMAGQGVRAVDEVGAKDGRGDHPEIARPARNTAPSFGNRLIRALP